MLECSQDNAQCTVHKWEFLMVEVSSGSALARPVQQQRIISAGKISGFNYGGFPFWFRDNLLDPPNTQNYRTKHNTNNNR
jgi:hypothetical protein